MRTAAVVLAAACLTRVAAASPPAPTQIVGQVLDAKLHPIEDVLVRVDRVHPVYKDCTPPPDPRAPAYAREPWITSSSDRRP